MRLAFALLFTACGTSAQQAPVASPAPAPSTSASPTASLPAAAPPAVTPPAPAPPTIVAIRRSRTILDTYVVFAKVSAAGLELLPEDETRVGDDFGWVDAHTLLAMDSLHGTIARFVDGQRDAFELRLPLGRGVTGVFAADGELWLGACLPGSTCTASFTRLAPSPPIEQATAPAHARLITADPDLPTVAAPPAIPCPLVGPKPRWVHQHPPIYEDGDRTYTARTYYKLCDQASLSYVGLGGELWAGFREYGGGVHSGIWTFYDGERELGTIENADDLLRANWGL